MHTRQGAWKQGSPFLGDVTEESQTIFSAFADFGDRDCEASTVLRSVCGDPAQSSYLKSLHGLGGLIYCALFAIFPAFGAKTGLKEAVILRNVSCSTGSKPPQGPSLPKSL